MNHRGRKCADGRADTAYGKEHPYPAPGESDRLNQFLERLVDLLQLSDVRLVALIVDIEPSHDLADLEILVRHDCAQTVVLPAVAKYQVLEPVARYGSPV